MQNIEIRFSQKRSPVTYGILVFEDTYTHHTYDLVSDNEIPQNGKKPLLSTGRKRVIFPTHIL